jgi:ATP-dependent Zn protease
MLATEGGTSDATIHIIEEETKRFLTDAVERAKRIVVERRSVLDRLVQLLLEKETAERKELEEVLGPSSTVAGALPVPLHFDEPS